MFDNDETIYAALVAISLDRLRLSFLTLMCDWRVFGRKITTKSMKKEFGSDMYELRYVRH